MDGIKRNDVCDVCGSGNGRCGKCGHYCGFGGYHILRWILGIIIITWIFSIGMKFGEIKVYLDQSGYGARRASFQIAPFSGAQMMTTGTATVSASDGNVFFTKAIPAGTVTNGTVKIVSQ